MPFWIPPDCKHGAVLHNPFMSNFFWARGSQTWSHGHMGLRGLWTFKVQGCVHPPSYRVRGFHPMLRRVLSFRGWCSHLTNHYERRSKVQEEEQWIQVLQSRSLIGGHPNRSGRPDNDDREALLSSVHCAAVFHLPAHSLWDKYQCLLLLSQIISDRAWIQSQV